MKETSASLRDALDVTEAKVEKLEAEEAKLNDRHERASDKEKSLKKELNTKKGQKAEHEERKRQTASVLSFSTMPFESDAADTDKRKRS